VRVLFAPAFEIIVASADRIADSFPPNGRRVCARPGWDALPITVLSEDTPPTILVLESREINRRVLRSMLKDEGYRILEALRAREAFDLLKREKVDLIVLDLVMPEVSGLDFCRAVKANRETRFIPVIVMTNLQGPENEVASIAAGADEFLVKPLYPEIVRARFRAMLRHKQSIDSLEEAESLLFALAQAVEHRDRCTAGHCERLSMLSMALGNALGLSRSEILALHRGGYLHDIGKIAVPDAILFKPGPLSTEEWAIMRTHTTKGVEICSPARTLTAVLPIIRSHHERWDGSGYPDGLRGEETPLLARILQIADVFDALTSTRPYKPAFSVSEALRIMDEETHRGWRDPDLMSLLHDFCSPPAQNAESPELMPWPPHAAFERSLDSMRKALLRDRSNGNRTVPKVQPSDAIPHDSPLAGDHQPSEPPAH
jgi:putative two-component system response regulator